MLCVGLLLSAAAAGPEANDRFRVAATPMLALLTAFGWAPSGLWSESHEHEPLQCKETPFVASQS
jgi:hypothetical protein